MHIASLICIRFRTSADGSIDLRRRCYDCYFFNRIQNEAHINAKSLFDQQEKLKKKSKTQSKEKTYSQSMISAFMVPKTKKRDANQAPIINQSQRSYPDNVERSNDRNNATSIAAPAPTIQTNEGATRCTTIGICFLILNSLFNIHSNQRNCVGMINSICGEKKHQVTAVHKHVKVDSNSSCRWGTYLSMPALCEKEFDGKGKCNAVDSSLACYQCCMSRRKNGDGNPSRWLTK